MNSSYNRTFIASSELFSGFKVEINIQSIKVLSGGEKRRMIFGKIILQRPNVIVLDEPTNHLDMESIESLNLALSRFDGTIIFASHDREFISSLATRIVEIKDDKIRDYSTNHELLRSEV